MESEDIDHEMTEGNPPKDNNDAGEQALEGSDTSSQHASSSPNPNPPAAPSAPSTVDTTIGSLGVTDPEDIFFVHSCNSPTFKYKYPQAAPTPDGEDDRLWNKIYTAADSRMYNKHHKSANESRKYRESGETRTLALRMLVENKEKHANAIAKGGPYFAVPKPPKPKPGLERAGSVGIKREDSVDFHEITPGGMPMSISEKIKSEGRKRKALSDTPSSQHGTPAPSIIQKLSSPAPRLGSPAPGKMDKPPPKKKGTAAPVKKPGPKKQKPEDRVTTTSHRPTTTPGASPGSSNDGGEYCLCRGPDDHRMMVFCEGGCEDWYHCSCVHVDEEDAKELLDRYICPNCEGERRTSWKRLCRFNNCNEGCRKAARVNDNSKYCSEEHKEAFWNFVYDKLRVDDAPSMGGALSRQEVADILTSVENVEELHALGRKPRLAVQAPVDSSKHRTIVKNDLIDSGLDLPIGLNYVTLEERSVIDEIQRKKRVIEAQIQGYKNQQELLKFVNERSKSAIKQSSLEVKDICGYDNRLAMNEAEFKDWFESEEGNAAFAAQKLGPRIDATKAIGAHVPYPGQVIAEALEVPDALANICLKPRKKCKHIGWRELHNQDFGVMQINLREQLKKLTESEEEIIDDAETREATKDYYADNVTVQVF